MLQNRIGKYTSLMSNPSVYILTGKKHSGKTTHLLNNYVVDKNVAGILSPVINGKRFFLDIKTKERFDMEASPDEKDVLQIGNYAFSQKAFDKAVSILENSLHEKPSWLIIDEIGPLELSGKGFCSLLEKLIAGPLSVRILIVIREELVSAVINQFQITSYKLLTVPKEQ
jgi:nucleoside-triphosphatase